MFGAETYIERRKRLRTDVESGLILLMGNDESPMNYPDNAYHFRQDSSFLYLFGLDCPGLAGVIDIDEQTECVFGNDVTVDEIICELENIKTGEREGRAQDKESAHAMQKLRSLGYM